MAIKRFPSPEADQPDRWEAQLRKGALEMAALASLWRGRLYGLEIIRFLEAQSRLVLAEGTIYPILNRLKADGLKPYLQPVPFVWDDYTGSSLRVKGRKIPHAPANFIVVQQGKVAKGKWLVLAPGDSFKGNAAGIILLPDNHSLFNGRPIFKKRRFFSS